MRLRAVVTDYIEPDLEWERKALAAKGIELAAYQLKFRPAVELMLAMYQSAHHQRTIALPITDDETVWSHIGTPSTEYYTLTAQTAICTDGA